MNMFKSEARDAIFSPPLHAMRGIAALVIFCCYMINRVKIAAYDGQYSDSVPFNIYAALTFFFVLSGFVLAISLARAEFTVESYVLFLTRRLFRIMPLMIVTVTIGGFYLLFVDPYMRLPALPSWAGPLTPLKFVSAYFGYSLKPNPPIWSIFIELVGCALLPFMIAAGRSKALIVSVGAALLLFGSLKFGLQNDWNMYMVNLFIGATILLWGRRFAEWMMGLNGKVFWLSVIILGAAFYLPRVFFVGDWHDPVFNLLEAATIAPLIALVFFHPERFSKLETPALVFLGSISFSLYLTHYIIIMLGANLMLAVVPQMADHPSMAAVAAACIAMITIMLPVCLAVAALAHRYIEQPGQELGRGFSLWLEQKRLFANALLIAPFGRRIQLRKVAIRNASGQTREQMARPRR